MVLLERVAEGLDLRVRGLIVEAHHARLHDDVRPSEMEGCEESRGH